MRPKRNITVYDYEARKLEKLSEKYDASIADIVEALCEYLDEAMENFDLREDD